MAALLSFLLISLLVSVQGFTDYESVLEYLEQLEQEVEEQTEGLKLLIEDGKKTIQDHHELELKKALARSQQSTEDVLKEAAKRKCPVHLKNEIASLGESIDDRWQVCMNMSMKLLEFENATFALYNDYLKWRPTICDAANNVSTCFNNSGILSKVTCAYDGLSGYMDSFSQIKGQMVSAVEFIHKLVLNTITDVKACFGNVQATDHQEQKRLLNEGCPHKRGKLLTTLF